MITLKSYSWMYSIDEIFEKLFFMEICNYTCHIDAQFLNVFLGDGEDSACPELLGTHMTNLNSVNLII